MRFLLDNNLSPRLADPLRAAGHDVVHVRDIGLGSATDTVVIDEARAQGRHRLRHPARRHPRHHALVRAYTAGKRTASIRAGSDHPEQPQRRPSRPGRRRHRGSRRGDATHPPTPDRGTWPGWITVDRACTGSSGGALRSDVLATTQGVAVSPHVHRAFHRAGLTGRARGRCGGAPANRPRVPVRVRFRTQHPLGAVVNRPSVWSDR